MDVELDPELLLDGAGVRTDEAGCHHHQIRGDAKCAPGPGDHHGMARRVVGDVDPNEPDRLDLDPVALDGNDRDRIRLAPRDAIEKRPRALGPPVERDLDVSAQEGKEGHIGHPLREELTPGAIRAVTVAQDGHPAAGGARPRAPPAAPEKMARLQDAGVRVARNPEATRTTAPDGEQQGVAHLAELVEPDGRAHPRARDELDAFGLEEADPPVHDPLLDPNAPLSNAEEPAEVRRGLVHPHVVTGLVQRSGRRQPEHASADHGDRASAPDRRGAGPHPPFRERPLHDREGFLGLRHAFGRDEAKPGGQLWKVLGVRETPVGGVPGLRCTELHDPHRASQNPAPDPTAGPSRDNRWTFTCSILQRNKPPTKALSFGTMSEAPFALPPDLAALGLDERQYLAFSDLRDPELQVFRVAVEAQAQIGLLGAPSALAPPAERPQTDADSHDGLGSSAGELPWGELSGRLLAAQAQDPCARPAVGDFVLARPSASQGRLRIEHVLPRRTAFVRQSARKRLDPQVLAANVDRVLVVTSPNEDFSPRRLERYLITIHASGAEPVIVLNKADLAQDLPGWLERIQAVALDARVFAVSARTGAGLGELESLLGAGLTVALVGSSGVGKSSLTNALLGVERQRVRAIREGDDKGRHTTTHRQLFVLPPRPAIGGASKTPRGLLVDTPGMRALALHADPDALLEAFHDIRRLAEGCRFGDCRHHTEPGCAVRAAAADGRVAPGRLASYRRLLEEAEASARRARGHRGPTAPRRRR